MGKRKRVKDLEGANVPVAAHDWIVAASASEWILAKHESNEFE